MLRFRCPHCQGVLDIHETYAGQPIACEKCGKGIRVPAAAPKPAAPKAAAPPPPPPPPPAGRPPAPPRPPEVPMAGVATNTPDALAHGLPGSGTVSGEPERLEDMPCDPLPADARRAADELGEPICSMKTESLVWAYYSGAACVAMGLFALVYAVIAFAAGIGPMGGRIAPLVLGLVFVPLGVLSIVFAWLEAQRRLWVCPNGLIWEQRGRFNHCRWDGVSKLHVLIALVVTTGAWTGKRLLYRYTLRTEGGLSMQLDSDTQYGTKAVGEFIQGNATRALLPAWRQRLRDGETLDFDAVKMDERGLTAGRGLMKWGAIRGVEVSEGNVSVEVGDGGGHDVPLDRISHVLIFLQLVQELRGRA